MKVAKQLGAACVAGMMCVGTANALALLDSSMYPAITGDPDGNVTVGGVNFDANGAPGAKFIVGSHGGSSGLGVTGGPTNTEIDIFETITMSWSYFAAVEDFTLALLYNGPEFGDVREVAQVSASFDKGDNTIGTIVGTLTVAPLEDDVAIWSIFSGDSPAVNQSFAIEAGGGAWLVTNPFGNLSVNRLVFTALLNPTCGSGSCYNQSDYVLSSVNVVPEPGTYSLLLAGLAAVGFIARRRRIPN